MHCTVCSNEMGFYFLDCHSTAIEVQLLKGNSHTILIGILHSFCFISYFTANIHYRLFHSKCEHTNPMLLCIHPIPRILAAINLELLISVYSKVTLS